MMNETKKISSFVTGKNTIISTLLFFGVIFFIVYEYQFARQHLENYNKRTLDTILENYELIKKTKISDELRDPVLEIVKDRKDCFSSQISYSERNNTCKRAYTNEIVQLVRATINSTPMRGLFIRCIRECPIAGSLCSGDEGTNEQGCIKMEARCIEYCLDEYWRGGGFPDNGT